MHKTSCQNILSEIQNVKEENHKVVSYRKETSKSSNQNINKIKKYLISYKKPATLAESISTKKSIIKKAKSVTNKNSAQNWNPHQLKRRQHLKN